jgi:hypothetical protein
MFARIGPDSSHDDFGHPSREAGHVYRCGLTICEHARGFHPALLGRAFIVIVFLTHGAEPCAAVFDNI